MLSKSVIAAAVLSAAPALATSATFNAYWGQSGDADQMLREFCDTTALDYITLAFVNRAPKAVGELPGTNFAAHCADTTYTDSQLLSSCTYIRSDIKYCQDKGKKIILSIGGVFEADTVVTEAAGIYPSDYSLPNTDTAEWFAKYLWGAFGPYDSEWVHERPFDYTNDNNEIEHVEVDGFDFDIEVKFDDATPYVSCVNMLRTLSEGTDKILTAAPQCPVGETNEYFQMKDILKGAAFDKIWIQYYNNDQCQGENFNLDAWAEWLSTTVNSEAEVYVGLQAVDGNDGYIAPDQVGALITKAKKACANFAGLMVWDANYATANKDSSQKSYLDHCASAIGKTVTTITASTTSTYSQSATSSSTSSASTSSIVSTTSSSVSASTTSSSASVSSTASSSSSSATESSSSSATGSSSSFATESSSSSSSASATNTYSATITGSASSSSSSGYPISASASASASASSSTDDDYCEEETDTASLAYPTGSNSGYPTGSNSVYPTGGASGYPTGGASGYPSGRPSGRPSGSSASSPATTSAAEYTTSTVYATNTYTITSCAASVTDCPARMGQTTTEVVALYTTICPVTATETGVASSAQPATTEIPAGYTTSTVYSTKTYVVTSCAATVTDCPAKIGQTTTEVVAVSTTVCPITETAATATGNASPSGSGSDNGSGNGSSGSKSSSASPSTGSSAPGSGSDTGAKAYSAVPVSSVTTAYLTVPVYPTGPANSTIAATGTVKVPAYSSSGVAAGTGKASSYSAYATGSYTLSTSKAYAATTAPAPAVTTYPTTAGSAKTAVFSFGGVLAVALALAM
ncbi:endochitinase [Seiridium cupressi]